MSFRAFAVHRASQRSAKRYAFQTVFRNQKPFNLGSEVAVCRSFPRFVPRFVPRLVQNFLKRSVQRLEKCERIQNGVQMNGINPCSEMNRD